MGIALKRQKNRVTIADRIGSLKKYDYIPVLIIALLTLLPLTSLGNLLRLGVAFVLFLFKDRKDSKISVRMATMFLAMLVGIFLSLITVTIVEGSANFSVTMHELQRFIFYILLILVVYDYKVPFKYIYWVCIGILLFNLTIQLLQYNDVEWVYDFIKNNYVTDGTSHLDLATTQYGEGSFRSGSIYLNPNVYMVIPSSILCVILQANIKNPSILNYLFAALCVWSLLLTGSRTTFFVALAILVLYFILDKNIGKIKWAIIAVGLILLMTNMSALQENFRVFDVSSGMENSVGIKLDGLISYLNNANPIYFITGSLSSSLHVQIDAEWGYVFSYFGLLGLYWYINFYILLYNRNKDTVPFMSKTLIIVIGLIAFTATIVLCMPVFSFFCLIGLVEIEV